MNAPRALRALVRADELWLAILAALIGVLAGAGVAAINVVTAAMHTGLFALPPGQGLSESASVDTARVLAVPILGGVVLGVFTWILARLRPRKIIDPIVPMTQRYFLF